MLQQTDLSEQIAASRKAIRHYAQSLTRNSDEADDLTQDILLLALEKQHQFEPGTNLTAWLLSMTFNRFATQYRQNKKRIMVRQYENAAPDEHFGNHRSAVNNAPANLLHDDLINVLNRLDRHLKEPFMLRLIGYRYWEIAQELSIPMGTVKSRLFIVKQELAAYFGETTLLPRNFCSRRLINSRAEEIIPDSSPSQPLIAPDWPGAVGLGAIDPNLYFVAGRNPTQVLYLQADGNYTRLWYLKNKVWHYTLESQILKVVMGQYPGLIRISRCVALHATEIRSVQKVGKTYNLRVGEMGTLLVSRAYNNSVLRLLYGAKLWP